MTTSCCLCGITGDEKKIFSCTNEFQKPVCSSRATIRGPDELTERRCAQRCFILSEFGTTLEEWSSIYWWGDILHISDDPSMCKMRDERAKWFKETAGSTVIAEIQKKLSADLSLYTHEVHNISRKHTRNLKIKERNILLKIEKTKQEEINIYEKTRISFRNQAQERKEILEIASKGISNLGGSGEIFQNPCEEWETTREEIEFQKIIEKPSPAIKIILDQKFEKSMESIMDILDDHKEQMPEGTYIALCNSAKQVWESAI